MSEYAYEAGVYKFHSRGDALDENGQPVLADSAVPGVYVQADIVVFSATEVALVYLPATEGRAPVLLTHGAPVAMSAWAEARNESSTAGGVAAVCVCTPALAELNTAVQDTKAFETLLAKLLGT